MPIMIKKKIDNKEIYICSANIDDGITILDKLKIVKKIDSPYSCIRTSSNKLLGTYIFFMKLLNQTINFSWFEEIA